MFFSCAGPRPTTSFSPGWPKTSAALGDQGKGTLWLRVEGSADERLRGSENLPYSGEKGITSGAHLQSCLPVLRHSECLWRCFRDHYKDVFGLFCWGKEFKDPPSPILFSVTSLPNASCSSCCCKKGKQAHFEIHGITANGHVVKSWSAMPEVHKGPNPWLCVSCPGTQILNPDPNLANNFQLTERGTALVLCKLTALQRVSQLTSSTPGNL